MEDEKDIPFYAIAQEKILREVVSLLKVRNEGDAKADMLLKQAVEENTIVAGKLVEAISNIEVNVPEISAPSITVNTDLTQLLLSIKEMGDMLNKNILELKSAMIKTPVEYEFKITRAYGSIDKITATPKINK